MKVLLDESVPRRLASSIPDSFVTRTVQQMGWAGCGNGELLRLAVDQGFEHQQNVHKLPLPVVILIAGRTRLQEETVTRCVLAPCKADGLGQTAESRLKQ